MTPDLVSLVDDDGNTIYDLDAMWHVITLAAVTREKETEYEAAKREEKKASAARDEAVAARAAANVALTDAKKAYQAAVDALAMPAEPTK